MFSIDFNNKKQLFIGIFSIVILLYIIIIYYNFKTIDTLLTGFWLTPPDFNVEAGLDFFGIFIGESSYFSSYRPCYILIQRDGEIFLNEPTELYISWDWFNLSNWNTNINYNTPKYGIVKFNLDSSSAFPSYQKIEIYPTIGKMILYYNDTIYAVLYKNPELSEATLVNQIKDDKLEIDKLEIDKLEIDKLEINENELDKDKIDEKI